MNTLVTIRRLQATDDTEWLRLRRALWPDETTDKLRQEMTSILADPEQQPVFVAEHSSGGLCGMVEVSIHHAAPGCTSNQIGYLEAWYVDPAWRQQGIGRRLVQTAEEWARSMGCSEMASDTTPEYSISPQAHAALGYQEVERYFRKDLT